MGRHLNIYGKILLITTKSGTTKRCEINMGFGKSFGLGLLVYLLLNFGLSIVVAAISAPSSIGAIFGGIEPILAAIFAPILSGAAAFTSLGTTGITVNVLFAALLLILPGLLAALVAGKSSDSGGAAFGGWLVAMIVASVLLIVLVIALPNMALLTGTVAQATIGLSVLAIALTGGMWQLWVILCGVTVGFLWGGVAAASAGP